MELARFWGVADDGEFFEVAVRPHLVDELMRRWPATGLEPRTEPLPGEPEGRIGLSDEWVILPDEQPSGDNPPEEAWEVLEVALTAFAAQRLAREVPVHSAAIAWKGRVLVVPAAAESGKSRLALAASEYGAKVLSDEYTLVDPATGLATGWTRPLRIRHGERTERLDVAEPSEPLPVGLVAFLAFDPELVGHPDPRAWAPIPPAQAVGELLSHTICARRRKDDSMDAALAVARSAPAIAGRRGDAADVIGDLLALMEASATEPAN